MYIYLNNSVLTSADYVSDQEGKVTMLNEEDGSVGVFNPDEFPFVKLNGAPIESAINNSVLQKYFMKAVLLIVPDLPTKREYGLYSHNNARAEYNSVNGKNKLRIECDTLADLKNIENLKHLFMAGTILPTVSYEKKQIKKPSRLAGLINQIFNR